MAKRKRRAKTTPEIVSALLALLGRRGAKRRASNAIVLMRSKTLPVIPPRRQEGQAPVLVQFGGSGFECCDEGIRMSVTVSFRGPLKRMRIDPLDRDGEHSMAWHILSFDETRWDLTDAEQQQAESGSVSHTFSLCVWCDFFTDNHTARFTLNAMHPDGQSIYVIGVTINAKQFQNCCP
jgi:hypothetical protein